MEIKKFEAYNYRGPSLKEVDRQQFLGEFIDIFVGSNICDYNIGGSSYDAKNEVVLFFADKEVNGKYVDHTVIKLDLSDLGIEFGKAEWNDETEEFEEFIPEVNLDSDITKQVKDFRGNIEKFNT